RFFSTNGAAYTNATANLGYTGAAFPVAVGTGYYQITVCVPASSNCTAGLGMPNPPAAPSYTVVATPVAGQTQVNDTQCTAFAVDSTGQQWAGGSGGTAYCWANYLHLISRIAASPKVVSQIMTGARGALAGRRPVHPARATPAPRLPSLSRPKPRRRHRMATD